MYSSSTVAPRLFKSICIHLKINKIVKTAKNSALKRKQSSYKSIRTLYLMVSQKGFEPLTPGLKFYHL